MKKEIIIYQNKSGAIEFKGDFKKETLWASQAQIAGLFGIERSVVTKHISNILKDKELNKDSVCAYFAHTAEDGKTYKVKYYNLDIVLAVGYRTNSNYAIQFRQWATKILRQHILNGYTINKKRLSDAKDKFKELQETISFLQEKSKHKLLIGQEQELLSLLGRYSKTLTLLEKYDKEKLSLTKKGKGKFVLNYEDSLNVIEKIKKELSLKKEAGVLFGQEYDKKLQGILGNIYQTFSKKELYFSLEEKAAHLLYFIIKDHPFVDGNKRIGSFLFVYFLDKNNYLLRKTGERKINDNALVALALLIAISDPKDKDKLIKIVTNLLQ